MAEGQRASAGKGPESWMWLRNHPCSCEWDTTHSGLRGCTQRKGTQPGAARQVLGEKALLPGTLGPGTSWLLREVDSLLRALA